MLTTTGASSIQPSEGQPSCVDFSNSESSRKRAVLYGLLIGDCLGSTSEFKHPKLEVPKLISKESTGWPFQLQSNFTWKKGESTDDGDMALCIVKSFYLLKSQFDPKHVTQQYLEWLDTDPKDVGFTTRQALLKTKKYLDQNCDENGWYRGSLELFNENESKPANGALMRNGVIPLLTSDMMQALEWTILHSIITHYSFEAVLPCIIHTILIHKALQAHNNNLPLEYPTSKTISELLKGHTGEWFEFKSKYLYQKVETGSVTKYHSVLTEWVRVNGGKIALEMAETKLVNELQDFETFEPYEYNYKNVSGWSILSLKIALWALYHSRSTRQDDYTNFTPIPAPSHLPKWPFEKQPKGFESIVFVVMIGADADTYGAITGPLMGAYYPENIPQAMIHDLMQRETVEKYANHLWSASMYED
ncbi:hypothetical protein C9374_004110 [Naegleria lovaniensis]|uniref:ADP-ribosylhydrolase ARH3 n=1 Tax=Naegleria lovaniensis TaxID=51637 RepID=A0AA88GQR3_NAELO|nr:uncharacterized protein C9374_004110 [Naegleria lovaniensis]KAG2383439.1 hypothetical protein C9374_004110 [Naegleria lovaniensis]